MENLFIPSYIYIDLCAINAFISISENNYILYKETDFINV